MRTGGAPHLGLSPLGEHEIGVASRLLGAAFRDNPMNRAVLGRRGPAARARANAVGLRAQLRMAVRHGRVVGAKERDELRGVLIALPPHAQPPLLPPILERLRVVLLQGPIASSRWALVAERLQELRPIELHWYLSILGVEAPHRGRGVGSELLAGFTEEADREALPAYLETDVESNIGFYARAGFTVVGDMRVLGVRVWRLWRPAGRRKAA